MKKLDSILLIKLISLVLLLAFSSQVYADYKKVKITNLNLNRQAEIITHPLLPSISHRGFIWNDGDNNTLEWRPQGIAGIALEGRKFLAVTWYHLDETKGARISLVDITDMTNIRYRHVLLVDQNRETLVDLHAGGLVYKSGYFHVPDSRSSSNYQVLKFSINDILEVPGGSRNQFHNYRYIMEVKDTYSVNRKPSFMSYDWTRGQIVYGSFYDCSGIKPHSDSLNCLTQNPTQHQVAYYDIGNAKNESSVSTLFTEMQGVGTHAGKVYVSCSYGSRYNSHFHYADALYDLENSHNLALWNSLYKTFILPPGLEDIHVSLTSNNIWTLTEFAPGESGSFVNNRIVFAIDRDYLDLIEFDPEALH